MELNNNFHNEIKAAMEEVHNVHFPKVLAQKQQNYSFLGDNDELEYLINTQKNRKPKILQVLA